MLKKILQQNPIANPQIRFGIGLCYFRLGNSEKARFAFERLIELDPTNSMAFVALAVLELASNVNDLTMRTKVADYLQKALQLDETNQLALKYLADHYFFKKDYKIA
jgi:RNA polymerase-associated protein CTR9